MTCLTSGVAVHSIDTIPSGVVALAILTQIPGDALDSLTLLHWIQLFDIGTSSLSFPTNLPLSLSV